MCRGCMLCILPVRVSAGRHRGLCLQQSKVLIGRSSFVEEETTAARDETNELAVHPSSDVYGAGPVRLNVDTSDYFPEGWDDYEAPAGGVDEELHGELSGGEEIEKIAQSSPLKPSVQEVDEHNVTHLPYCGVGAVIVLGAVDER